MNVKKVLSAIALLVVTTSLFADEKHFVLEFKDNSKVTFAIMDKPILSFDKGVMKVGTEKLTAEYILPDINKFYFLDLPTNIDDVHAEDVKFVFTTADEVTVYGADSNAEIIICDAAGKVLPVDMVTYTDCVKINTVEFPRGIYIISIGKKHTAKFVKK